MSRASGSYPECMILENIQMVGKYPVASGGFADVRKALLGDQVVALKVLRVHGESDLVKLLKVALASQDRTIADLCMI
jgi:hypothetical protein